MLMDRCLPQYTTKIYMSVLSAYVDNIPMKSKLVCSKVQHTLVFVLQPSSSHLRGLALHGLHVQITKTMFLQANWHFKLKSRTCKNQSFFITIKQQTYIIIIVTEIKKSSSYLNIDFSLLFLILLYDNGKKRGQSVVRSC